MNVTNTTEGLLQFMPTSSSWARIPVFVLFGIVFLIGCPGNIVLLAAFLKQAKTSTNWVIITIPSTDLVYLLVHIPMHVIHRYPTLLFHVRGSIFCKLYYFVIFSLSTCRTFLFDFLAVDRFMKIHYPRSQMLTENRSKYICVGIVFVSSFLGIPHLFVRYSDFVTKCVLPANNLKTIFSTFRYMLSACSLIHLSVLYIRIVCTIQRRRQKVLNLTAFPRAEGIPEVEHSPDNTSDIGSNVKSESEKVNVQTEKVLEDTGSEAASKSDVIFTISHRENATKRRNCVARRTENTTKIIFVTIFLFIFSSVIPSLLTFISVNIFDGRLSLQVLAVFSVLWKLDALSSCINPVCYLCISRVFRKHMADSFSRVRQICCR